MSFGIRMEAEVEPAELLTPHPVVTGHDLTKSSSQGTVWTVCGRQVSRSAVVFVFQITILYISIITCFINLTVKNGPVELWITILSLSLGSILPSPKVKKVESRNLQPHVGSFSSHTASLA